MARNEIFNTYDFIRKTARGYVWAYVEGVKPKATLNWAAGFLKRVFHERIISAKEMQELISTIAQKCEGRAQMLNRLQKLKMRLKEERIIHE